MTITDLRPVGFEGTDLYKYEDIADTGIDYDYLEKFFVERGDSPALIDARCALAATLEDESPPPSHERRLATRNYSYAFAPQAEVWIVDDGADHEITHQELNNEVGSIACLSLLAGKRKVIAVPTVNDIKTAMYVAGRQNILLDDLKSRYPDISRPTLIATLALTDLVSIIR